MNALPLHELNKLLRELTQPEVALELALLLGCLVLAFALSWFMGRKRAEGSIWFGRLIVDGLLFPLLSLVLAYSAGTLLGQMQTVALLRIAVPVLMSLVGIRLLARVLTLAFPVSNLARLIERLFSWLAWLAAVLWIVGLLPLVLGELESIHFVIGKSKSSLLGVLEGIFWSGMLLVLALWLSAVLERRILREAVADLSLRKVAANAVRALLLLLGIIFALSAAGVDLTALSVIGGALGVGLGFGLQKLAANYVSGFVILFERSLRIGDIVRVDNFQGTVMDIKTRYTLIRAANGHESIVPNEKLITERIENLSLADSSVLLSVDVTVGYDSDTDVVMKVLLEAALSQSRVMHEPAPAARLVQLGAHGLEFQLLFWVSDPQNGLISVRSDVNLAVLKALQAAAIDIPYPQTVLHWRGAAPEPGGMCSR